MTPARTPSQTVGPFLRIGLDWEDGPYAIAAGTPGAVRIAGRVLDGEGTPVPDALVETWQPDPAAFARCCTDDDGAWFMHTPAPAPVDGHAPHLAVSLLARGLLHGLATRIYLPEHAQANVADPVLARVPADRRGTLVAQRTDDGYRFDIRIQGPGETVFFDV